MADNEFITKQEILEVKENLSENYHTISGIGNSLTGEIKTNYEKATNEVLLEGLTNSLIILGNDRTGTKFSGLGGLGNTGTAAIDIIAGHMGPRPIDRLYDKKLQFGKDFENDASRIYLTQKGDLDKAFKIPEINIAAGTNFKQVEKWNESSGIGIKSDRVRIIARENIKLVTFHKSLNSRSKTAEDGGIDILAGINAVGHDPFLSIQPMVKGNNLIILLQEMVQAINNIQATVSTFMSQQREINDQLANHCHQSGAAGRISSTPVGTKITVSNFKLLTQTLPDILKNEIKNAIIKGDYFNPMNPLFINSLWNRVN